MDRRARLLTHLLVVVLALIAGVGLHAASLQHRLDATVDSFGALEQDRTLWKTRAEAAEGLVDSASASLNHCSAQVDDLKSLLVTSPRESQSRSRGDEREGGGASLTETGADTSRDPGTAARFGPPHPRYVRSR